MTKEQVRQAVSAIVRDVLRHDDFNLTDDTTAGDIKGWDSLSHMLIISGIEKHFDVKFGFMEMINFNTMSDLFNSILSKITP